MKLQKILSRLQKLHPKEIDLSLDRVKNLCKKLGNPQEKLKCISVVGTNGKYSTIQAIRAILNEANINVNIYTSPHIQKINERFIFNNEEISDEMSNEVTIAKHNIDEEPNTPTKYGVRGIPTMLLFKDGELKSTKVGAIPKSEVVSWIKENI